jgi:hypothetical protein
MHVRVYVTDDGTQGGGSPTAFVYAGLGKVPGHPNSLRWRYWATVNDHDPLLDIQGNHAVRAIQLQGFYISEQGIHESGPRR